MEKDLQISEMMKMQKALFELNKDKWSPMEAEYGRQFILWMIEEVGECIAIIKKKGDDAIMNDEDVREAFVEEMSDVMMYFTDTLLRYDISAEEISEAYVKKHCKNQGRDYSNEYDKLELAK
ncbi:MAG: hypothetical protein N4A40_01115 [Tissierellales bacterium]|jgi:NTP pyrophosphatase (non-canonical NTP hydrolase)|nr:hypothetical protein [Tissierellales bacterium]